ncbi:hypothetical protein ACFL6G_07705 [candidate division KSB1 bacterium]
MSKQKRIYIQLILIITTLSCNLSTNEPVNFKIRFSTWGSLPFSKELLENTDNQKILYAIRNNPKDYLEISTETSIPEDSIVQFIKRLSQLDLVVLDLPSDIKWKAKIPIYNERELNLAETICLEYAKGEVDIIRNSIDEIQKLYNSLSISSHFEWDSMSWIIIGALICDLAVIDRVRFFTEYRDERYLPQLHPDGKRWSLRGYLNLNEVRYKERKWSFSQAWIKDETAGLAVFGYYKPDIKRKKPPKNPLYLAITDYGDILFNINNKAMSLESIREKTEIHPDTLENRIDYLISLDPPAIRKENNTYLSAIPIFPKDDFKRLLLLADRIASRIHLDITIPCSDELEIEGKKAGLTYSLPDGVLIRDIVLKLLVDEGILPDLPNPPTPWNFGVWGWEGPLLLWEDVK